MEKELTGNYPIILEGKETGTLNVSQEGLFWYFEASSDACDGIVRLSVYGDDGEGYLGVMEPKENRLRLKKKLSRSALSDFPGKISYAGKQGEPVKMESAPPKESNADAMPAEPPPDAAKVAFTPTEESHCTDCGPPDEIPPPAEKTPSPQEKMTVHRPTSPPSRMQQNQPQRGQSSAQAVAQSQKSTDSPALVWRRCGYPASYLASVEGKSFFGMQKNVLDATDGTHIYLAVPEASAEFTREQSAYFKSKLSIMGESYLICKLRNGKVV